MTQHILTFMLDLNFKNLICMINLIEKDKIQVQNVLDEYGTHKF